MKAVILAGGLGTRLSEETVTKPKPLVEIGGRPILWHIMKIYSTYGVNDFVVCLGYKGHLIKDFFADYSLRMSDVTFDLRSGCMEIHKARTEPWKITLVDTGRSTLTGGRLKRIKHLLNDTFCMTYGDGVGNVDISRLIKFHKQHGKLATVTAVSPPGRFGLLDLENDLVKGFIEKPAGEGGRINGGFFVLEPEAIDTVDGDDDMWEAKPIERLVTRKQLAAYCHDGFWQPMDTLRDKNRLEELWNSPQKAPWKLWDD